MLSNIFAFLSKVLNLQKFGIDKIFKSLLTVNGFIILVGDLFAFLSSKFLFLALELRKIAHKNMTLTLIILTVLKAVSHKLPKVIRVIIVFFELITLSAFFNVILEMSPLNCQGIIILLQRIIFSLEEYFLILSENIIKLYNKILEYLYNNYSTTKTKIRKIIDYIFNVINEPTPNESIASKEEVSQKQDISTTSTNTTTTTTSSNTEDKTWKSYISWTLIIATTAIIAVGVAQYLGYIDLKDLKPSEETLNQASSVLDTVLNHTKGIYKYTKTVYESVLGYFFNSGGPDTSGTPGTPGTPATPANTPQAPNTPETANVHTPSTPSSSKVTLEALQQAEGSFSPTISREGSPLSYIEEADQYFQKPESWFPEKTDPFSEVGMYTESPQTMSGNTTPTPGTPTPGTPKALPVSLDPQQAPTTVEQTPTTGEEQPTPKKRVRFKFQEVYEAEPKDVKGKMPLQDAIEKY